MTRRGIGRFALAVIAFTCAMVMAEFAFRSLQPGQTEYSVAATGDQYRFYQFDSMLGWRNAPGAHGTFERGEFRYEVAINSHGMRQEEVGKVRSPGARRIAVLGDSFVWGIGVADQDRFTERIAAELQGVEVLNFGVSGYAPVQYLLDLDRVLEFAPDLVVVVFCLGNDFVDNVQFVRYGYPKPYADLDERGELRVCGFPLPRCAGFGFRARTHVAGSALLGALRDLFIAPVTAVAQQGLASLDEAAMYDDGAAGQRAAERAMALRINEELLVRIRDRLRAAGVGLLVVPAPTKFEYNGRGATGHEGEFPILESILVECCRSQGIDCLPMVHRLHGDDFWGADGHWNVSGHGKVANAIASSLAERGLGRRREKR